MAEKEKPRLPARILAQIKGQWPSLSAVFLLEMLSTPLALLSPIGIKIAVDNVVGGKPVPPVLRMMIPASWVNSPDRLLVAAILIQISIVLLIQAHWFSTYLLKIRSGEQMLLDFRFRLFGHLQRLPINSHDRRGCADSTYRLQEDAAALKSITIDGALFLISDLVKLIAMACVTLLIDRQLGILALSVAPLLALYSAIYQKRVGGRYKEVKDLDSLAFRVAHEALSIIRVVKAFVQEEAEENRFLRRSRTASDARIRLGYSDGIFGVAVNLTTAAGMAMVLYVGIRNIQSGILTLGSLLLVITYLVQLYAPLQNITYHLASLKTSAASVERALEVFDAERECTKAAGAARKVCARAFGSIEFQNVTFAYKPDTPILQNFSFEVPPGARVGLVGRTGAGKTTLINLLVRFISPAAGRILLDGQDIEELDLSELRRQFAFVLQDPVLFSTTVAENIAYGRPSASHAEIVKAAQAASAHEFIEKLPQGYETNVGERGALLSGGERQRVSIARAFLQDAPVLIMDEPTSSLDVATESEVLEAMERLSAGRTCFIVSHRPNTLANCDFIFKVVHGAPLEVSLVETATHLESLLGNEPLESDRVPLI
jgi:ATP-binding cassette subfamily B protein